MKPTYSYPYDVGHCSVCGVQVPSAYQHIHDDMHRKLDELSEEIGILKVTLSGLASVAGPMGPPGEEGLPGKDAVGSEMFMRCQECSATIHVSDEAAHDEWHDLLEELFEDNQLPMIEEDPSGPPPEAPKYVVTYGGLGGSSGMTTTYGSGTYIVNSGTTS
jgi:hypothetical protein